MIGSVLTCRPTPQAKRQIQLRDPTQLRHCLLYQHFYQLCCVPHKCHGSADALPSKSGDVELGLCGLCKVSVSSLCSALGMSLSGVGPCLGSHKTNVWNIRATQTKDIKLTSIQKSLSFSKVTCRQWTRTNGPRTRPESSKRFMLKVTTGSLV